MVVPRGVIGAVAALALVAAAGVASTASGNAATPMATAMTAAASGAASPSGPTLPLSHAGRWLTDASGRVVIVHGVNMVAKSEPYYPAGIGFDDDDAVFLHGQGFTVVRVGLYWKALEPEPGQYDASYVAHVKDTVDTLAKHGILSLVDWHQDMWNEEFHGLGAPDWAVQDGGLPNVDYGFPNNYIANQALQHAEGAFWSNAAGPGGVGLQDRYAAAWAFVAKAFKHDKSVLGYELMNEPAGDGFSTCLSSDGCPKFDKLLAAFGARITAAIRKVDPRTLIWEEPDVGFNGGTSKVSLPALKDKRSGFSFHPYCFALPTTGTSSDCDAANDRTVKYALAHVAASKQAVVATEFGATGNDAELVDEVQRLDDNRMPWIEWAYPEGLIKNLSQPPTPDNIGSGIETSLTEPYPYVVAGTPIAYHYSFKSHVFSASYSTKKAGRRGSFAAGSRTLIETPAFNFPSGYTVSVKGATVASKANAAVLVLSSKKATTRVTVTVRPKP